MSPRLPADRATGQTSQPEQRCAGAGRAVRNLPIPVESAWGAVPVLPPGPFPRPLAEPAVRISPQRALHGGGQQALGPTVGGPGRGSRRPSSCPTSAPEASRAEAVRADLPDPQGVHLVVRADVLVSTPWKPALPRCARATRVVTVNDILDWMGTWVWIWGASTGSVNGRRKLISCRPRPVQFSRAVDTDLPQRVGT
jgi:hypothetical protein